MARQVKLGQCYFHCKEFMTCPLFFVFFFFFFYKSIYALDITLNILAVKVRTPIGVWKAHFGKRDPSVIYWLNIWTTPPQRVHHCLVYFLIRHPFSKVKLQNKRQMRFFKKELKKGKTFHNEEKQQKKVFHVAVLSLFFSCLKLHVNVPHWFFFFPFLWLLISFYFLYGGFFFMQVLFSSGETPDVFLKFFFSSCRVFKSSEYVVYEVRWKELSWSGAFVPSEGEFLSFIFYV